MCGIIGYIGTNPAGPVLIDGLKRLEYRGYDSAGIATITDNKIQVRKKTGKLRVLSTSLNENPLPGTIGIGHTRWATHGIPSEQNAHPHLDCTGKIVIVHNGIIENFQDLRTELLQQGHQIQSQTDTEIIVHLIEREYILGATSLETATRAALKYVVGTYALGILSLHDPDKLVAARNGSPLVIGLGNGENYIASDVPAILKQTRQVIFLDDKEIAILTRTQVTVTDLDGKVKTKPITPIDWDTESAEKEGYPHFMLKEIHQQPQVVRDTLRGRVAKDRKSVHLPDLNITQQDITQVKKISIVACGTAYYVGLVGKYILEKCIPVPIEIDLASEFRYRHPQLGPDTVVLGITQSGETADTLASLRYAKEKGAKIVSICNVVGSTIARESDGIIYTHAGPEICVASTKAYTAQMVAMYLFTIYLGQLYGTLSDTAVEQMVNELSTLPELIQRIFDREQDIVRIAEKFYPVNNTLYLGRWINYPNALEGALKLKEISYIHAEGYAAGEMKHGPIALIDENMLVICIAVNNHVYDKMVNNIQEVRARNGRVVAIVTEGNKEIVSYAEDVIYIPPSTELFSPILVVVPTQLLAYYMAVKRECDIDQPRNLAKSVTVE